MALEKVAGFPAYESGSPSQFIPAIWSKKLRNKHYENTVLTAISNTDWEGEIKKYGDKVEIRVIPSTKQSPKRGALLGLKPRAFSASSPALAIRQHDRWIVTRRGRGSR